MNKELTVKQLNKALADYNEYGIGYYDPYEFHLIESIEEVESTNIYDNESYKELYSWIFTYEQDHSVN